MELLCQELMWQGRAGPAGSLGSGGSAERAEEEAASHLCYILQSFQGPCYLAPASCPLQSFILSCLLCFLIPLCSSLPVAPVPPFTSGFPITFPPHRPKHSMLSSSFPPGSPCASFLAPPTSLTLSLVSLTLVPISDSISYVISTVLSTVAFL